MEPSTSPLFATGQRVVISIWLDAIRASLKHFDPYTVWSLQTMFRQFPRGSGKNSVMPDLEFVVGLDHPYDPALLTHWPSVTAKSAPWVPPIYEKPLTGQQATARHVTLRVPSEGATIEEIEACVLELMRAEGIQRLQIGFPRPAIPDGPGAVGTEPPMRWGDTPPKVVLGLLDDACAFAHPALRMGPLATRVAGFWDQSLNPKGLGDAPPAFAYGTEVQQNKLDALIGQHASGDWADEEATYADPASRQKALRLRASHGTAVLTLMAGDVARIPGHRNTAQAGVDVDGSSTLPAGGCGGATPDEAAVVVVQFPREQVNLSGGRWLSVAALDGLRYLAHASEQLAPINARPLPLVANMSYGGVVGAHDGTALLESAMTEMSDAHGELAIVLAAGNAHGTRRDDDAVNALARVPSGAHARQVIEPGASARLALCVPPNKMIETYLEMWFSRPSVAGDTAQFLGAEDVEIDVTSPWGRSLHVDTCPGMAFDDPDTRKTCAGLMLFPRVAQSLVRSMALLVIAATQITSLRVSTSSGTWTLRIRNRSKEPLILDAWVERDVVPGTIASGPPARLLPEIDNVSTGLSDMDTFNSISTGSGPFRVGALVARRDAAGLVDVSPYSSAARTDEIGPEFSAVSDEGTVRSGIRVSGSLGSSVVTMNGTSVAAPQAARWIAEQLASGVPLAQLRAQLANTPGGTARRGRICL